MCQSNTPKVYSKSVQSLHTASTSSGPLRSLNPWALRSPVRVAQFSWYSSSTLETALPSRISRLPSPAPETTGVWSTISRPKGVIKPRAAWKMKPHISSPFTWSTMERCLDDRFMWWKESNRKNPIEGKRDAIDTVRYFMIFYDMIWQCSLQCSMSFHYLWSSLQACENRHIGKLASSWLTHLP